MDTEEILENISRLRQDLNKRATPSQVIEACAGISIYLADLSDKAYDLEREYKVSKADKYAELIKAGIKPSPAEREVSFDKEIINKQIEAERLKGLIKRLDSIISTHQSLVRLRSEEARNNL